MKLLDFHASRSAAPTSPRAPRRATARPIGDFALVGVGVATAVASIVFACDMLLERDHAPRINGMQYLAIFARLRGSSEPPLAAAPPVATETRRLAGDALDMAPTGSIARDALDNSPIGSIGHGAADGKPAAESYRIIAAEPGMAWLSNGAEIRIVKPGDVAPGLARIASIVRRDGRWMLLDESGATLVAGDGLEMKGSGDRDGPFARRMIFSPGD